VAAASALAPSAQLKQQILDEKKQRDSKFKGLVRQNYSELKLVALDRSGKPIGS
jgi:hypothetical protein